MKFLKYIVLGLGVALIPIGMYIHSQYKRVLNTCYLTAGIVLHKFSPDLISFTLLLKIKNLTDFAISLKNTVFDIYFMDIKIAELKQDNKTTIHATSCSPFSVDVSFNPSKVLTNIVSSISDLIKNKENVKIKIVGKTTINALSFTLKNYKIETSFTIKELLDGYLSKNETEHCKC